MITVVPAAFQAVREWCRDAEDMTLGHTSGRKGDASASTRDAVAMAASWHCQFDGCGADLRTHFATRTRGNFGYFAHVVASSPLGPRGDALESARLADDPKNFLLLCDQCHRLVDRVEPDRYPTARLQAMRERSIERVAELMAQLRYPEIHAIAWLGSITGQVPHLSLEDVDVALCQRRLRRSGGVERYFAVGGHNHDPHADDYWAQLSRVLTTDLPRFQALIQGSSTGAPRPRIAVFPQHSTSVLVLGGRVLGDHGGTQVFQPHRNVHVEQRWDWPQGAQHHEPDKFFTTTLKAPQSGGSAAAVLLVDLSCSLEDQIHRLPSGCQQGGALSLPTVRVTVRMHGRDVIGHPDDLVRFGEQIDRALAIIQDQWRSIEINLIAVAPAAACVVIGQKLQARNQALVRIHESYAGAGAPFLPTVEIGSRSVRVSKSGQEFPLLS